jgi:hypothetical protein
VFGKRDVGQLAPFRLALILLAANVRLRTITGPATRSPAGSS